MKYYDKNGTEIQAGMLLHMEDGSIEKVYATADANGEPDLGINASNEAFLENHPEWAREYYSLQNISESLKSAEIVKYFEVEISKHTKRGKRNETSMCMLGVREPSVEEALMFLARDIIFLYKCDHVDAVREISQEEAYSAFSLDDIEATLPVFRKKGDMP